MQMKLCKHNCVTLNIKDTLKFIEYYPLSEYRCKISPDSPNCLLFTASCFPSSVHHNTDFVHVQERQQKMDVIAHGLARARKNAMRLPDL